MTPATVRGSTLELRRYHPYADRMPKRITPRQHELIGLLVRGRSIAAAARELGMSVHTARAHVKRIALRLPNPYGLPAHRLILAYFEALRGVQSL